MSVSQFNFPTRIVFGCASVQSLPDEVKGSGFSKPLIVTDRNLVGLKFFVEIIQTMTRAGLDCLVSDCTLGNPLGSHVSEGLGAYKKHGADLIIAVGGGAALDVAKAIAVVANNEGDILEYDALGASPRQIINDPAPLIAVPTTSGTGSEVGRAAVISDDLTHQKKIIFHPGLMPHLVIADPELTCGIPKAITAATGFDALTHNIEAYLSKGFHPMCDAIALEGMAMIFENLQRACEQPQDLRAREQMMAASLMGAVAFQKGLGVTHSCAHALSTVHDMHHGLANAVMLEACLRFNGETEGGRLKKMAQAIGLGSAAKLNSNQFIEAVVKLRDNVGIKGGLKNYGVSDLDPLVKVAINDFCHTENPRTVSEQDFMNIYKAAL
jgi:alcohol dehydrogenase class IV